MVISSWGIGGEQKAAGNLIDSFISKGHKVDLITFRVFDKILPLNEQVNLIQLENKYSNPFLKNLIRIREIRKKIKKSEYDIVVGFAIIPSIITSFAGHGLAIPLIITERSNPEIYNPIYKFFRNIAYRLADGGIFQTNYAKDYFVNFKKMDKKVIPNPINLNNLPYSGLKEKRKRIVTTGRLVEVKNHSLLIEAFAIVLEDFPEYELAIYGDGHLKEKLTKQIKDLGINENATIYDATPQVLEQIQLDTLFVLPSNHEGFPNSLAEAMALGIPSISTDCLAGGPRDLIKSTRGILVETGNLNELVIAIKKCLLDQKYREELGHNALEVRDELDVNTIANYWLDFFDITIRKKIKQK